MAGSSTEGGATVRGLVLGDGFGPSGATVSDDADLLALAVNNVRGGE